MDDSDKECFDEMKRDIADIKADIKNQGEKSKRIANITTAMGSGLAAIIFAGNFTIFNPNPCLGYAFLAVGGIAVIGSWVCWCRLLKL